MKSAKLWMITDSSLCEQTLDQGEMVKNLAELCEGQSGFLEAIVLREKTWTEQMVVDFWKLLSKPATEHQPLRLLNWPMTYAPWDLPIDGLHLSGVVATSLMEDAIRLKAFEKQRAKYNWHLGLSIHNIDEWIALKGLAPSYVFVSNIFETPCKLGNAGLGLYGARNLAQTIKKDSPEIKVIGLGGLKRSDSERIQEIGLDGMALRSELHK